ncbi:MAG: glycosyltransferase, partial [Methyloceanibacter sp.]
VRLRGYLSPRVTVIISTCNRAKSLERALEALRHQAYPRFEVVGVNGPSTDDTDALLKRNGRDIKAAVCPEPNLGMESELVCRDNVLSAASRFARHVHFFAFSPYPSSPALIPAPLEAALKYSHPSLNEERAADRL